MVVRAVSYCRISHDPTGMEKGVDRQQVDTEKIAKDRGWTIVERVVDNDRSASEYAKRAREGWARVLELIAAGEVDAVVAYDTDRLTRQPKELQLLIEAAGRGLKVATATGQLDLSSAGGRLVARMLCDVAAHEADRVKERITAKLRHDAMNGRQHWVRRPFGYTLSGEVIEEEAEWMRTMWRWLVEDCSSLTSIATRLNQAGVVQGSGKLWQAAGVKFLLTSARNAGLRTYHGEVVGVGKWSPIFTETQWRDACAAVKIRSDTSVATGRRSMLTGLVRCGRCGEVMYRTNAATTGVFRCVNLPNRPGCGNSINAPALEELVAGWLFESGIRESAIAPPAGEDIDSMRAQLAEMAELVGSGAMTMTEWKTMRDPIAARLDRAERELSDTEARRALTHIAAGATLEERWPDLDVSLRRRVISLVLERVTIGPATRRRLDLDRVTPTWREI